MATGKIIYEGEIILGETTIPCYVLEDGTRVLSGNAMQNALHLQEDTENKSGTRLERTLNQKSLNPYIYKEKEESHYNPIVCYKGKKKINGYEAELLADICDAFLDARKNLPLLSSRQNIIATQCEILIRGFARVGLIALVDEATGYQYQREENELQKILEAYVSKEALKWQLTFPNEYYTQIYRLWKLSSIPKKPKNRPAFIGHLTIKYIYKELPTGVLDKIREKTGKTEKGNWKHRLHQVLTTDIGREHLKKQIIEVTALMSVSESKEKFEELFAVKYKNKPFQPQLEFNKNLANEKKLSNSKTKPEEDE